MFGFLLHALTLRESEAFWNSAPSLCSRHRPRPPTSFSLPPAPAYYYYFASNNKNIRRRRGGGVVPLHGGIVEWRDAIAESGRRDCEILMLPFRATDALVPGQSQCIVLKEGRFLDLFQDCIDLHHRVLGIPLMGEDSILDSLVLCEIDDFSVDAGYRGKVTVAVTLRAVGRAMLQEIRQMKPFMTGVCREIKDDEITSSMGAPDLMNDVQSTVETLGRQVEWQRACRSAMAASGMVYEDDKVQHMVSASWAVFAVSNDKSKIPEALLMTSAADRLQLGLKALLNDKFIMGSSQAATIQLENKNDGSFE